MNTVIKSLRLENFRQEILEEREPVLVLCMHCGPEFQEQIDIIEGVHRTYGERLKACLVEEEFLLPFKEKFNVKGTPTFMIFVGGVEKDRMLGLVDHKVLEDFLLPVLMANPADPDFF